MLVYISVLLKSRTTQTAFKLHSILCRLTEICNHIYVQIWNFLMDMNKCYLQYWCLKLWRANCIFARALRRHEIGGPWWKTLNSRHGNFYKLSIFIEKVSILYLFAVTNSNDYNKKRFTRKCYWLNDESRLTTNRILRVVTVAKM